MIPFLLLIVVQMMNMIYLAYSIVRVNILTCFFLLSLVAFLLIYAVISLVETSPGELSVKPCGFEVVKHGIKRMLLDASDLGVKKLQPSRL